MEFLIGVIVILLLIGIFDRPTKEDQTKAPKNKKSTDITNDSDANCYAVNWVEIKKLLDANYHLNPKLMSEVAEELPTHTAQIYILAVSEKCLIGMSTAASFSHSVDSLYDSTDLDDGIRSGYTQLSLEFKYQMMPLFFSPDMMNEESLYIRTTEVRNAALDSFKRLIEKDGLTLENLKQEYLLNTEYHYLLPIHPKLPGSKVKNNAGLYHPTTSGSRRLDFTNSLKTQGSRVDKKN